ncbi:tripartite tricarboxylate transporter substrate binding protein [Roseomonas frigidaquae]|uniref:Tripartite tricarboxylate transporter substrate binding protein n=1 Tax=Falsiroseomonas frigidaquae TaxID=487318 RepID=A0ABX1F5H8_9PROT|nr:tripartite tricarboxylate transporter substrate binding protein [Falsiroseomonas frigidaquae]NKE47593.1 tripartite tricarboxylate transporter substrate binding protein [Falsiroseomonas frigidaquae]
MIGRRLVLAATGAAAGALAAPGVLRAQGAWPSRNVRIVVPFGLGGSADVAARFLAEPLSKAFGQSFVVENRPGAGASIGTDAVAKSAPDGHTLLLMSNTHTANETLLPNRPYVLMRDLAPVASINIAHHVLAVHPSIPATNLQELIALLRANPGKYDYASSGPGTPYHVAGAVFLAMANAEATHVPFRGSNEARTALVAGTVPIMFDAIPTMAPQIEGGSVRGFATTGPERSSLMPNLPAVAEALPGYEASIWLGFMAPAATPLEIRQKLNTEINRILALPETRAAQLRLGAQPRTMTIEAFEAFVRADITKQAEFVRMAKMTPA